MTTTDRYQRIGSLPGGDAVDSGRVSQPPATVDSRAGVHLDAGATTRKRLGSEAYLVVAVASLACRGEKPIA
jgi:hypothetical protein